MIKLKLVEDPVRFDFFKSNVASLSWNTEDLCVSLNSLFNAIDELAKAEVDYYYKRRKKWAQSSGVCRGLAWLFGSVGLLTPLIGAIEPMSMPIHPNFGYIFIAFAGIFLAANSLFNWTEGHVRYLKTQLTIESLITSYRIKWCENLACHENGTSNLEKSFALITDYSNSLHTAILSESGEWGEAILTELKKYEKQANKSHSA